MAMALRSRVRSQLYTSTKECRRSRCPSWIFGAQSDYHSNQLTGRGYVPESQQFSGNVSGSKSRCFVQLGSKNIASSSAEIRLAIREPLQPRHIFQRSFSSETHVDAKAEEDPKQTGKNVWEWELAPGDLEVLENNLGSASSPDESVGNLYLRLAYEYVVTGESPEKILRCAEQALKIFNSKPAGEGDWESGRLGLTYHMIGLTYIKTEEFEKALTYLQKSRAILEDYMSKQPPADQGTEELRITNFSSSVLIGEALSSMGKPDEAVTHLRVAVREQEALLGSDHVNLGSSYRLIAETLTNAMKYDEALPSIQKAIEIHAKANGDESVEVAVDRRVLAVIYIGLEQHEEALAQHKLVRKILAGTDLSSQTVFVDIATADTEITLGKYDDAIASLETAVKQVEHGSAMHALALVNLAKVHERQGKKDDADKYAQQVIQILEKKVLTNSDPLAVAEGYTELAALYERLTKTERAIEMLKKAHSIYAPIPHQRHAVAGTQAQIGMLLLFTGKVAEAVPHLENAVETLEETVGEQNYALAMVLNQLGVANLELERLEDGITHFERAKGIFDEVLGADHDDTIAVARNLVNANFLLDRLDEAIKYQEEVVRAWEKKDDEDEFKGMLGDARMELMQLKNQRQETCQP
ncbi:hypothetical protein MPTK1_2g07900 [Marchantia polymorpha subsp. ruderalis]|uniref:MalT-like TPR region domain-containing protein n=2 Tax=Marchantia polymorpha TaxID=3197 RepID=A0A176WF28_MARPO|nr:hypothetical protein AXG93_3384s1630 [Marchantia polymorpha subsp. ruderalis]PTQ45269.1 hypothetical protein MARPO_0015s0076 [Marchantia polymorpha]BBN01501.1 hypothetical protein Mp_2g07900 [Marchantia polymorpha subsp. ruderalis]|eukprot:PTQ45269.1 hypothetical protein MARPO_0015s0076 [Marchantia polymorpha]